MSKRDIQTVCTLAAHLAIEAKVLSLKDPSRFREASQCAADAMALQRLGRSAMNALDRLSASEAGRALHAYTQEDLEWAWQIVINKATEILSPYRLKAECRDEPFKPECLYILGLPGNTLGGEEDGYGI